MKRSGGKGGIKEIKYPVSKETPQMHEAFSKKHLNNALERLAEGPAEKGISQDDNATGADS